MVGIPATGSSRAARSLLARYSVGNLVLMGTSSAGTTAVATALGPVRRTTMHAGVQPWVAVDQEGGRVQHLTGAGFSVMPTALRQGELPTRTLRADWRIWAGQLRRAGVNLDLAPVADVVPAAIGTRNQPIGAAGKHFPGLGRASGNTDTTVGVTDPTRRYDAHLPPYASAISAGSRAVMVSTATYPNIQPGTVAAFSHLIVTTMLRHDLHFTGVILSDDLLAASLTGYSDGVRAIRALDAGIDVLLVTARTPVVAMASALVEAAPASSA